MLRILVATTTWWAMPARLASACSQAGVEVYGICPQGSPLCKVSALQRTFRYSSVDPLSSLVRAIELVRPDLVVPCDDRVVGHLHCLYSGEVLTTEFAQLQILIRKSLGNPSSFPIACSRSKFLDLARAKGLLVPETAVVASLDDLRVWIATHPFPLVLKADGSWGGSGVRIARSLAEAECAYLELRSPASLSSIARHMSFHDFFALSALKRDMRREITVQAFISGECRNAMFACWQGEVLGGIGVEVLASEVELGAASVVRTIADEAMERAGQVVIRELQLSGFCGLDFIKEEGTGKVYLIELNPRATQLGHLRLQGRDPLATALVRELEGIPRATQVSSVQETIAFFPQVRTSRGLGAAVIHDVPVGEPALMEELQLPPWNTRHFSALTYLAVRKTLRGFAGSQRKADIHAAIADVECTASTGAAQ